MITVSYRSVDNFSESRRFKTLAGAQRYARMRVGDSPEIGCGFGRPYAISDDGIGRIMVKGASLADLFPET